MNTQLIETLAQIIQTLSQEERALLEQKLQKPDWREVLQQVKEHRSQINTRRANKPVDTPAEEIIHQMREERTEQLMRAGFPELYSEESK